MTDKHDAVDVLLEMIDRLLDGHWSVEEFRDGSEMYYYDKVPEEVLTALSISQQAFFTEVYEMLSFTDATPDPGSRRYGCKSNEEYVEWLRVEREKFRRDYGK